MNQAAAARTIEAVCDLLVDEPLFHASLGSRELFHSNLLAWMVDTFPALARQVLEPWLTPGAADRDRVRREFRRLDLVVELEGFEAIAIENKTFALPDEQQLERCAREAIPKLPGEPTLLLVSLIDPGWPGDCLTVAGRTWRWVSYRQLGERLAAAFADSLDFAGQIVAHEAEFMLLLERLVQATGVHDVDEPFELPAEYLEPLRRVNIADAVGKARAHQVMRLIRQRFEAEGLPPTAWQPEVGFSNGQPLLAAFWDKGDDVVVGWQYQGGQWRLAMILGGEGLKGRGLHEARAAFAREHTDYFDFGSMYEVLKCTEDDCLPRRGRTGRENFNRYDPDFVYQYRLLPDVSVRQFVDLVTVYSRWAVQWNLT